MPINEDSNGRNRYDPTKRIRGTLGSGFTRNAEADALSKLNVIANTSAIRTEESVGVNDSNNGRVKVDRFNVIHTNPSTPFTPAKSIDEVTRRLYSKDNLKKNVFFGHKGDDIRLPIINNVLGEIPSIVVNNAVRNSLESGKIDSKTIWTIGFGTIGQFGIDTFTRFNTVEYNKYFDNLEFSKADISVINKTAILENVKFSGVKIAKEIVAPTVVKFALNKFLPKKATENSVYKVLMNDVNIPRMLTSVTGTLMYNKYANKVVEKAYKADSKLVDVARAAAVKEIKSRISISEMNVECIGNLALRVSDLVSTKHKATVIKPSVTEAIATKVEKKPVKKVETKETSVSTKKSATTKKTVA